MNTPAATKIPALSLRDVGFSYRSGRGSGQVLQGVTLELLPGMVHGLVGESGCGKSTLGRLCTGLIRPDQGSVTYRQELDLSRSTRRALRAVRPRLQMIFQHPHTAFNPRLRIGKSIDLNLRHLRPGADARLRRLAAEEAFADVLLGPEHLDRFPDGLSGGQLQRAAIARALLARPDVLVADEIVSALDVVTQKGILDLLSRLTRKKRVAVLFISHDLGVIASISQRILVMEAGRIVEQGETMSVLTRPMQPATRVLIEAVPRLSDHT